MIMEYCEHGKMWEGGGINVSIICIVTLFLAEYCGFGWVVGTFFWVFWFCFGIAWRTKFKHWWSLVLRRAGPPLPPLRPSSALRASSGLRSGNGGPACPPTFAHSDQFSQNLILLSQKSNLLSQNEFTQPTETPLCLWYDVFVPRFSLFLYSYKLPFLNW